MPMNLCTLLAGSRKASAHFEMLEGSTVRILSLIFQRDRRYNRNEVGANGHLLYFLDTYSRFSFGWSCEDLLYLQSGSRLNPSEIPMLKNNQRLGGTGKLRS